jgi:RimJ/RimL family protein N-acetyltransferase
VGQIVVGDPGLRRSGIGTASLLQLLEICFAELGLHRVQLFVDEDNLATIACCRKAGFRDEGLMRDATKTDRGYVSRHSMSILEESGAAEGQAQIRQAGALTRLRNPSVLPFYIVI